LILAAAVGWQIAGVDPATGDSTGIFDPCVSDANSAGGCWFSCPLGDGDRLDALSPSAVITVHVVDGAGFPIWNIPATDFYLLGCTDGLVLCGGGGAVNADQPSDESGNTTMSGAMAASGCDIDGVVVVVLGVIITDGTLPDCPPKCLPFDAVTPDITGDGGVIDGAVDAIDFGNFGLVYDKPASYDPCFDYNCDGMVELADFGDFGLHWEHSCQGPASPQ
jgi:hypothetical protein